jgi:hypothetical protein
MDEVIVSYKSVKYFLFWWDKALIEIPEWLVHYLPQSLIMKKYFDCKVIEK